MFELFGRKPQKPKHKFPPRSVGLWLAKHLDERCTIANISKDQRDFAELIDLPLPKLFDELACLSAFSIDFAIISLLHQNPAQNEVREGFMGGVQDWPSESVNKSVKIQIALKAKGQQYLKAALAAVSREAGSLGDPLSDIFRDFVFPRKTPEELAGSENLAAAAGRAHMLAVLTVQADFWYYQNLCQGMFAECGLVRQA